MRKRNIQEQIKPVFDFYKNNLEDIMNSNINDRIPDKNNF